MENHPFIKYFIFIFTFINILLILFLNHSEAYDSNEFILTLNNQRLNYIYREKYDNILIHNYSENTETGTNSFLKNNEMLLDIHEYEVYNKNNYRVSGSFSNYKSAYYDYKEVNNIYRIKIKKNNKILYDGEYKKDLSDNLNTQGRYFLHLYFERKINLFSSVKTELSINFTLLEKDE